MIVRHGHDHSEGPHTATSQLSVIQQTVRLSAAAGVDVWLRGGWALDFFLGEVTREHLDIDFFCRAEDADRLVVLLHEQGFRDDPGPPPEQQRDLTAPNGSEVSFALLSWAADGCPTVAGGAFAGERWPADLLDGGTGQIGDVVCPIVAPRAQIEIKQMMPVWVPGLRRRPKDAEDIARLNHRLSELSAGGPQPPSRTPHPS
ncbi:nucleotidyltransferase domain-containing protein [Actinoplanes sp. TFC3]|uniref:nucleotidyltransferase domain-containing protein n=1 Tax=Actinoplanes sp. TFC3 TaxID=1710355 RepID=UPI0008371BD7|nr:hypothetical protein [Actinoplanes sp. TFC3]